MPIIRRLLGLLLICALTSPAGADAPPAFHAVYEVSRGGFTLGRAEVNFQRLGARRYHYHSLTQPTGLAALFFRAEVEESSHGLLTEQGPKPLRYEYIRRGRDARHAVLRFDWEQGEVVNDIGERPWRMPIPPDALDRLVSPLQLMHDLRQGERELVYPIADGGKLKTYRLRIDGEEMRETAVGTFRTLRVVRVEDSDKRTTLWCAPELGYLAVHMEQQEEGESTVRLSLRRLDGLQKP
ncbi:DUF3108 domain-containing protein [Alkalilimnicola sp. S0819]|uniref:DUF3108 domain-containing protein n=1 Tax=Alkalilimnicola sp. S0819 TaxID=2613922 RepID=UPI00126207BA|nr:DUF3108 domain-containing protein [Alkalilimnicola sp. S0819]KAB7623205.1 DUF3108 domain-containing protein [Alkalilimnicola sp. S0819]MPQ17052.1 DUF3108 domain-containing protein [Alkalilimnicola sp. S0819]